MHYFIAAFAMFLVITPPAKAESVNFPPAGPTFTPGASVPDSTPATLSLPRNTVGRVPAVVIVHASAGLVPEGPERDYVTALNGTGIATLVIDMWGARGLPTGAAAFGGQGGVDKRPRGPGDTLPDAFGALKFLAANPAIDAQRIGIMGFSWGAQVSFLTASDASAERALGSGLRFAAHAGHYLVCWVYLPGAPGNAFIGTPWTNAPIQLQVAGQDDYDDADGGADCTRLIEALPPEKHRQVELIVHAKATHAWDVKLPGPTSFQDRHSHRGRGGTVRFVPDETVTAAARSSTVAFFNKAFGL